MNHCPYCGSQDSVLTTVRPPHTHRGQCKEDCPEPLTTTVRICDRCRAARRV